jgi:hypothetical protein
MLIKNPGERIDATTAYNHPWLQAINENAVLGENERGIIENIETFKVNILSFSSKTD